LASILFQNGWDSFFIYGTVYDVPQSDNHIAAQILEMDDAAHIKDLGRRETTCCL
jgi:hypothetical protein